MQNMCCVGAAASACCRVRVCEASRSVAGPPARPGLGPRAVRAPQRRARGRAWTRGALDAERRLGRCTQRLATQGQLELFLFETK